MQLERPRQAERKEETLLKASKADNLTNDTYSAALMSGFMSGNSLRAAVGCPGLGRSISSAQQGAQVQLHLRFACVRAKFACAPPSVRESMAVAPNAARAGNLTPWTSLAFAELAASTSTTVGVATPPSAP